MSAPAPARPVARLVDADAVETLDVLGPTVDLLTSPDDGDDAPLVIRGTIPAGGVVPLHSHAEPDLPHGLRPGRGSRDDLARRRHVDPPRPRRRLPRARGAKHAWRNRSPEPAVSIIVTTGRLGRFFRAVGTPAHAGRGTHAGRPADEAIEHFLRTAERYGYWNGTPEENAAVGALVVPVTPG